MANVIRLEYTDDKSNKFWEICVEGASHTVRYGKIGKNGTTKTKEFDSRAEAQKSADKLTASKNNKGYKMVESASDSTSVAQSFDAAAFEEQHGIAPPSRFQKFLTEDQAKKYDGKYVMNLPHYSSDSKFKIQFCEVGFELFEDNDVDRNDYDEAWMPLAYLAEEPQFLAVNLSDDACPVAMWEHEDGMFHALAPSLDEFLAGLVAKSHKPPIKVLKTAVTKATKLKDRKKHQQAIDVLESALVGWTPGRQIMDGNQGQLPAAYNLLGICLGKVDRLDDAMQAYKNAVESGTVYAALNILDTYDDDYNDPAKVIEYGKEVKEKYLDAYCWFWVRKYVGRAYIATGAADEAATEYREILERFQTEDIGKIDDIIEDLGEYVSNDKANSSIATEVLGWFKKKEYSFTAEQAEENQAWWRALPSFVQDVLADEINMDGLPSDEDIARMFDIKSIDLDDGHQLSDVAALARVSGLERLSFYGSPTTLEPLRSLPSLARVMVNGKVIKNLELPNISNQPLFDAVNAGDIDAINKALDGGANVNAKDDDFASSAIHLAVMNHDVDDKKRVEMALLLIERGGDPYAQNMDDADAFEYCGSDDEEILKKAFAARGGTAPGEGPFKIADEERVKGAAALDSIKGFEEEFMLDEGVPLLADYPVGEVTAQMRTNYPGHKKDKLLCDYHECYGTPIISAKLKSFLDEHSVVNVEYLPITILDHKGKSASADYFILNALAQDCLDVAGSEPDYNSIDDSIREVKQLIINSDRVAAEAKVFRIKSYGEPMVFRSELAEAVLEADFTNIAFELPKR